MVSIFSADGKEFKISREEAQLSLVWKDEKDVKTETDSVTLGYIVDFLALQKGVRPPVIKNPLISTKMSDNTTKENADFIDRIPEIFLFKLSTTSMEFIISSLGKLSCAKIGTLLMNKTNEEKQEILDRLEKGEKEIEISEK